MDDKTSKEIENYYKLKSDYERSVNKLKKSILNNDELSINDKRKRFNLLRPKCIICKNPVGSIFTIKDRTLIALCGATQNKGKYEPCTLDIKIKRPSVMLVDNVLEVLSENLETIKEDIISTKVKSIFNLIQEENAINNLDEFKKTFNETNKLYNEVKKQNDTIFNNEEKKELIKTMKKEIMNKTNEIINLINSDTLNEQLSRDAVEIYINQLLPLIEKFNENKYSKMYMDYDEDNNNYTFIQEETTIKDLEFIV